MPLKRDARADLIGTDAAKTTVAASGSSSAQIDVNGTNKYHEVSVWVVVVFGGSADGNVQVTIFPYNSETSEADTEGGIPFAIPFTVSTEKRQTIQVPVTSLDQIQVLVENEDTTDSVDVWVSYIGAYF